MTAPFARGDRVRLNPKEGGDVFDLALQGRKARVESVEEDFEGRTHVGVVLEDDPGRELGARRQPGHHFFFAPEDIELLPPVEGEATTAGPYILVAGIGNIFLGDDAFGVEVAQRLASRTLPRGVRVMDSGIRGLDLAYTLLAGPDRTILVDACPRGEAPGTVFVMEPDLDALSAPDHGATMLDAHDMNPLNVLRLARSLGATLKNVVVVGCEPATLGPPEGLMGLSPEVEAAVPEGVALVESLIVRYVNEAGQSSLDGSQPQSGG